MKKLFSIFAALLFAGSMMAAVGNLYYTLQFVNTSGYSGYATYKDFVSNGMTWNIPGNMTQGDFDRIGGNSLSKQARYVTAKSTMGDAISRIIITHNGGNRKEVILDSITVTVASDADFTEDVVVEQYAQHLGNGSAKIAAGTITLEPTADNWAKDSYYKVTFFITNSSTSNGGLDVASIAFYSYQDPNAPAINAPKVDLGAVLTTTLPCQKETTLAVTGANLNDAITYSVIGSHVAATGTLTAAGGTLNLTLTASAEGTISDTIVLVSGTAETKVAVEADVIQTEGEGTKASPLTYADVIKINNRTSVEDKYWVVGYIVGSAANGGVVAESDAATNLALGATVDQTENIIPVELPSGSIRTALNIVDNTSNKGKKVKVHGVLQMYFNAKGVKGIDDYEFIEEATPSIEASKTAIDFGTVEVGAKGPDDNAYLQETFTLTGTNLTGDVRIEATTTGGGSIFTTNGYRAVTTLSPTDGAINSTIYAIAATGFAGTFNGLLTISSDAGDFEDFTVALSIVVVEPTKYYLKNNWDGGSWTWKEMTKVGADQYKLNNVVFGGSGVNFNTAESDEGATWVAMGDFTGDIVKALDTVNFDLTPSTGVIYVQVVGAYIAPATNTYTVAGSSTDVFGTSWDPTNTANDMTLKEGTTYEIVYTNVTLPAGTISFKVCLNHAWTTAYPANDYNLNIAESGIYKITITFDTSNNAVNAVAEKTGSAVVLPTILMHGTFTGAGNWFDTDAFTVAADEQTASLTLTLAEGDVEFGVKVNGTWTANGATITRANPSTSLASGSGNMHLTADVAGDYTFTWTYATQTLAVTFPALDPTNLENANAENSVVKVIENGQLFIIKNGIRYNAQGVVVR